MTSRSLRAIAGGTTRRLWQEVRLVRRRAIDAAERWLFGEYRATYGLAVCRILLGLAFLGNLLANFGHRSYVWGPASRWQAPLIANDGYGPPFTSIFPAGDSLTVFTIKYLVMIVLAVSVTLGWRTRLTLPLLVLGWTSLARYTPLTHDAGDNVLRIFGFYGCFANLAAHFSLDARRRRRQSAPRGPLHRIPTWVGVLFSNVALLVMGAHVSLIYIVSGLTKVQGSLWQNGSAMYYPLHLDRYQVWPFLSSAMTRFALVVVLMSYISVFIQVFFPLLLMRRYTRRVALVVVVMMHSGIAFTLGLPWFSLAMIAVDMIFLRDSTFIAVRRWFTEVRADARGEGTGRSRSTPTGQPLVGAVSQGEADVRDEEPAAAALPGGPLSVT